MTHSYFTHIRAHSFPTSALPALLAVLFWGTAATPDAPASSSPSATTNVPAASSPSAKPFAHPGLLHSQADFDRMKAKVAAQAEPWTSGWNMLVANPHSQLDWEPHPDAIVYRGRAPENYTQLYNDIAAAYADALRWKVSGDNAYADKAIEILNAWGGKLTEIQGTNDRYLASGIYGYEIANAAEIMRTYPGWTSDDFTRFQKMMLDVFYPMNHDFLLNHNNAKIDHYWANWDLCNLASLMAIGVLTDRRDIYAEAIDYFKNGAGNGSIEHVIWKLYPDPEGKDNLGQWQESGRDQGHCLMGIGILGSICQMAWTQGDDLFSYDDNRFLKGAEYVAKYNLGQDVPYTAYTNSDVSQPVISESARGGDRPSWELVYNHYVRYEGLSAPFVEQFAAKIRPEGGGGDYGKNSGGYDQLGYGTLTCTLDAAPSNGNASSPVPASTNSPITGSAGSPP